MRLMGSMAVLACGLAATAQRRGTGNVRADARAILEKIISIPSSAGLGQVPAVAQYLADRFRAAGFPEDDIHVLPSGDTASLVVRYRGNGKGGKPILLLAHMDVVTAKPEDWERDPFKLVEENGYFFGRGTHGHQGRDRADHGHVPAAQGRELRADARPDHRVLGRRGDADEHRARARDASTATLTDAEFALNGDGGGGTLDEDDGQAAVLCAAGRREVLCELRAHGPQSGRAQFAAARRQRHLRPRRRAQGAAGILVPGDVERLDHRQLQGGGSGHARRTGPGHGEVRGATRVMPRRPPSCAKNPAMIGRTRTTCVATMLTGGHADNALPQSATATVNCRIFPGTSVDEVRDVAAAGRR